MKIEEIEIPAPWGHIAARLWGDSSNEPIIVIHGVMDNVGAFNRLIPLLPQRYYYICIDLPGHGKSSHWPPGAVYNSLDILLVYKIVVDYFARDQYTFLGHSYGGQLSMIFAQMYPEHVTKLILLDTIYLYPASTKYLKTILRVRQEQYFETMEKLAKNKPPEYTYEEALDKICHFRRYGELSQDAGVELLERMIIPTGSGKYKLSTDQRLKFFNNPIMDFRYISQFLEAAPITCPVLFLLASESDSQQIYFERTLKQLKKLKNVRMKIVEGNHDVHNNHPERVAPLINEFLLYRRSKL